MSIYKCFLYNRQMSKRDAQQQKGKGEEAKNLLGLVDIIII